LGNMLEAYRSLLNRVELPMEEDQIKVYKITEKHYNIIRNSMYQYQSIYGKDAITIFAIRNQ